MIHLYIVCGSIFSHLVCFTPAAMSARPRSRKRPILAVSSAANVSTRPSQKRRRTSASVVDKENACSIRKKDSASKSCHGNQVVPDDDGARFAPDADFENLWDEDCSSSTVEKQVQLCDPKGYFVLLPTEVLHALLTLLDHRELAALGRTSSELLYAVEGFVFTHAGVRHVLPPLTGSPSHFAALGEPVLSSMSSTMCVHVHVHVLPDYIWTIVFGQKLEL